ncbi:MAG: UDP-N-acetylmuramoyl-L-alanyl-D-glutamate--2,6-diaminopimelate ligase [Halioglobus sp.]|nr:UDP-N-acetylmuramoyl-L-alanyl-D-glutamate--2,6-diaminopimelate ligase [Halioglobus sp.]
MMLAERASLASPMPLGELLGRADESIAQTMVSGLELDSRCVRPGDLFLAMPGDVHDGRQFIEQAVANGASAIVAEAPAAGFVDALQVPLVEVPELRLEAGPIAARFYGYPSRNMHVVGITGTNGKTTTSRIVAQLSRSLGKQCGVIGTLGATLGDDVAEAANTTPDPVALQRQLATWQRQGVPVVSMEVSSHALVQGRVNGVEFTTAIFTNLSHDHLYYHGSMADYARAKMRLFAVEGLRHAVINLDDELAAMIAAATVSGARIVTYSARGGDADLRVLDARSHAGGVHATLRSPWGRGEFDSPLPGDFNLANLAAAIAALLLAGEELLAVLRAVRELQPVAGRMQRIPNEHGLQVFVDYAHTPHALEQVLQALRPHVAGRLITVFGCGGDRDREKRQVMGRVASTLSDAVVVTSDNPRSEEPSSIIRDIAAGLTGDYTLEPDRAVAIAAALDSAREGDCVLIAGKGHEDYQLIEGQRLPFSDAQAALDALARRLPA